MAFHLTQGTFSFLPPLTDDEIRLQVHIACKTIGRSTSSSPTIPTRAIPTGICGGCRCLT